MSKRTVPPLRDKEEARKRGRNGGLASGKARQKRKELRELLEVALSMPDEERGMSNAEAIAAALVEKAKAGDVRAFEALRDTVGEKPVNRLDHTSTDGSLTPAPLLDLSGRDIDDLIRLTREAYREEVTQ
ncbi:MAG: hypothetical protein HDQ94_06195 [Desulfovibrio sp.]|nr:hypothetical protein [Desulfovibrio sp.]